MNFLIENWFKLAVLALLTGSSVGGLYYLYVFQPTFHKNVENKVEQVSTSTPVISGPSQTITAKAALNASIEKPNSGALTSSLLKKIMDRVVFVKCYGSEGITRGSGTLGLLSAKSIVTNFHVITMAGGVSSTCTINTPTVPDYSLGVLTETKIGKFDSHYPDVDVAILHTEVALAQETFPLGFCVSGSAEIGDKVTLFGYPSFGGTTLTVTDGIVSGFMPTPFGVIYKTSAKVDQGVSGGLAVLNKSNCVLGIPTWASYGGKLAALHVGETLGLIQSWDSIKNSGEVLNSNPVAYPPYTPPSVSAPQPIYTPPPQESAPASTPSFIEDQIAGENYYKANRTCIDAPPTIYNYCLNYAFNH